MEGEKTLSSIERRIENLERQIYGNSLNSESKCIENLMNIQNRLQSSVTGREKITSIFSKLDDLEKFLSPAFQESVSLTDSAKLNLVLLEEDRIRRTVDALQTVKDTMQFLDSEHIRAVPSLCPKLYEVCENQIKLQQNSAQLTEETRQLIANYDDVINSISKEFILWDSMLTEIEKRDIKKKISS